MSEFKINSVPWENCIRSPYEDRVKPKGIIMWLDDVREMPPHFTHWVKTADQAIELLRAGEVIECSLDHDLGSDFNGTGYDVASWIEEQAHAGTLNPVRCKVHSQNVVGAKNMKMALRSAYRAWDSLYYNSITEAQDEIEEYHSSEDVPDSIIEVDYITVEPLEFGKAYGCTWKCILEEI